MTPTNKLRFQYLMRGQQLQYLDGDLHSHAIDQRDRDLEDYLGTLAGAMATLTDELEVLRARIAVLEVT